MATLHRSEIHNGIERDRRRSVWWKSRQFEDVNTCVDDVLAGLVPARVVFSF
jgi:hypothetical protein